MAGRIPKEIRLYVPHRYMPIPLSTDGRKKARLGVGAWGRFEQARLLAIRAADEATLPHYGSLPFSLWITVHFWNIPRMRPRNAFGVSRWVEMLWRGRLWEKGAKCYGVAVKLLPVPYTLGQGVEALIRREDIVGPS